MAMNASSLSSSSLDDSGREMGISHDQTHETIVELEQEMEKLSCELLELQVNAIEFIVQLSTKYGSEIDYDTASVIKSCGDCQQFYATCQKRIADLENILVHSNSKVEVKTTATTTPTSTGQPKAVEIDEMIDFESENKEDMSVKIEPMEESEKLD